MTANHPFERNYNHETSKSVAEYFAGIGLVRLGLEQSGWKVVFANDFDPDKHEIYEHAFGEDDGLYRVADIFSISPDAVPSAALATCSFPCIDLSLAGKQNGLSGKHSSAFWGFVDILRAQDDAAPPLVMLENVTGWLHSNQGEDFRLTIQALNSLGYNCDVFELDAIRFTPQSRPRVFVVGARHRKPLDDLSALLSRPRSLASSRLKKAIQTNSDLLWCNVGVPEPPPLRKTGLTKHIVEDIPEGDARWWSQSEILRHLKMMAPLHLEIVNQLKTGSDWSYRTMYRRMRSKVQRVEVRRDDTAGCLRTARGGSSRQLILAAGKGQVRMRRMTPREYARLQGVPDSYPIRVSELQALNGFGDAVCVPAIAWIAKNVLERLFQELKHGGEPIEEVGDPFDERPKQYSLW